MDSAGRRPTGRPLEHDRFDARAPASRIGTAPRFPRVPDLSPRRQAHATVRPCVQHPMRKVLSCDDEVGGVMTNEQKVRFFQKPEVQALCAILGVGIGLAALLLTTGFAIFSIIQDNKNDVPAAERTREEDAQTHLSTEPDQPVDAGIDMVVVDHTFFTAPDTGLVVAAVNGGNAAGIIRERATLFVGDEYFAITLGGDDKRLVLPGERSTLTLSNDALSSAPFEPNQDYECRLVYYVSQPPSDREVKQALEFQCEKDRDD